MSSVGLLRGAASSLVRSCSTSSSASAASLPLLLLRGLSTSSRSAASAEGPSTSAHHQETAGPIGPPKLVVFGGRGFVGSHVCQEALATGLHVVAISPSGTPPVSREPWTSQVEWVRGSALEPRTYSHLLPGSLAAISCVGAFGSQADMLKVNGTANVAAIEAAKAAGIPRFVFISANIPNVPGIDALLQGYVKGKQVAEEALRSSYPTGGVALRPGVIYGNRVVSSSITLPLQLAFQPLEMLLSYVPNSKQLASTPVVGALFVPPVSVDTVAKAAVRAATDPAVPPGVMDVWEIQKYA